MNPSQASPPAAAQRAGLFDHPLGFWFFFWGEFAERCCYYGMRAILLLYMIQIIGFTDGKASEIMSYFIAACYLLPLVGGYVADNFFGKYRTIVFFSVPYIFGQALLGIASLHNETCLFLSLGLLAMGSGVIKPNISTLMGLTYDQRRPGQTKLRSDAFAMFYGAINIGAALSSFCVPWIRNFYGGDSRAYAIAFLFPAGLMVLAFIVFAAGKPFYAVETIHRVRLTPEQWRERITVLSRLFALFLVVTVFWSIFDQSVSTWTLFARDFLHLELFGFPLSPDQVQAVNPVLIVLLLPPITMLWHLLAHWGWNLKPTSKMFIGFSLTAITMAITAWAAFRGAGAVTAGAPAALKAAEQTAAEGAAGVKDAAAMATAAELAAAIAEKKDDDALAEILGRGDLPRVALAAATRSATTAVVAARAASDALADGAASRWKQVEQAAKTAEAAAGATKRAVKAATKAAHDGAGNHGEAGTPVDFALCSMTGNRAAAAASAAARAAEFAARDERHAAEVNAAVAALASSDAAVSAARAAAGKQPATTVAPAEQTAAAARISLLWQVVPYLLLTIAEICISVVGLELAFAAAPATMKSFVTACWLLTVFFANIINAQVTPLYNSMFLGVSLTPARYFLAFALLMIPVTLTFMFVARRFNRVAPS